MTSLETTQAISAHPAAGGPVERLAFIKLAPGVTARRALILVIVCMIGDLANLLIPIMQPDILRDRLRLDPTMYGRVAGMLATVQNVAMIVSVVFFGTLSDRIGRRPVLVGCFAAMGLVCFLYPFTPSVTAAVLLNFCMGLGVSGFFAAAGAAVLAYPDDRSRGGWVAMLTVTQRIAASLFIGVLGTRLPRVLTDMGFSLLVAGGVVFWLLASICVVAMVLSRVGFDARGRAGAVRSRPMAEAAALLALVGQVLRHAREQPRFGMLLLLSCAFRADLVVVYTFLSLWVVGAQRSMGIDGADAMRTAGSLVVMVTLGNMLSTIVCGYFADRMNRSFMLLLALGGGGVAFSCPLLVTDTTSWPMFLVAGLIGLSEAISAMATQTLLGRETPAHLRGSVTGAYTVIGMLGALAINSAGGFLFDRVSFVSPFVMVAVINIVCLIVCVLPGRQSFRSPLSR